MTPFGLTQHLEMCVGKNGYGDHHKVTLLFLEALYIDPPPKYKGNSNAWLACTPRIFQAQHSSIQ